jgi:hypothetical protein
MLEKLIVSAILRLGTKFTLAVCICMVFGGGAACAQRSAITAPQVAVTKAEGVMLGRGNADKAMFVAHRVDYCFTGRGSADSDMFRIEFSSKNVDARQAQFGNGLVRGQLMQLHEPPDGKTVTCGALLFDVHADAVVSVAAFAPESKPVLVIKSMAGETLSTVSLRAQSKKER